MKISKEEFENLSKLASLSFDSDKENIVNDLEKILTRFESLSKIDTTNVEPTSHVTNLLNSMRDDDTKIILSNEEILQNSPENTSGQIKIPRVFDNE
ncbi:MAG: Asp-tRNA(Asn)/Glu-tRNA(Gln) amidotransferase GatCAB subunit C [Chloroflexi bacterium]|nr:Asp-tRNA(Asn)/Glu-tRNA(Gln) amidotransferase GatCAB subunit C [Chloroflexota bacterium]|tara:strand:- start:7446 stop:7736 length:291 start_codon:yes stop_codon:yes gene_type:complete